jgi:WXG100 family type VII secretion target
MAGVEVSVDYEAVLKVAAQFRTSADEFSAMLAPLQAEAEALSKKSFVGQTGAKSALALEAIQARIRRIVQRCQEMTQDLDNATADYRAGDSQGADRFKD